MTYKARIRFADKEWLLIDEVEYEGVKYYYIIEDVSEELNNLNSIDEYKKEFLMEFIYQVENKMYKNVTDADLKNQLFAAVGAKALLSKEDIE